MRNLLIVSVAVAIFAGCSAPKYTYYFDRYTVKSVASRTNVTTISNVKNTVSESSSTLTSEIATAHCSTSIQEQTLVASTSKEILVKPSKKNIVTEKNSMASLPKITWVDRKGLTKAVREFRGMKKDSPQLVKEGNKRKNGFAIAGFISSLLAGIGILILVSTPVWTIPFIVGSILTDILVFWSSSVLLFGTIGIILSAVGLKSEKKRLAKTGLYVGIFSVVLHILFIIAIFTL